MAAYTVAPLLTERDDAESSEGGIDPLGLYTIADALGVRLVPGVRERQSHPRFLTAMSVSLAVCGDPSFEDEAVAVDGVSEPWLVFEWYLVEGIARGAERGETLGLPGSQKAASAIADGVPLSATRYLKSPAIFGFHGIYRLLARTLGIEQGGRLGEAGFELLNTWAKEQGLEGFVGTATGAGQDARQQLVEAVQVGLERGATARSRGWSGWNFFRQHLGIYEAGRKEARRIATALLNDATGFRQEVIEFLISPVGRKAWEASSERRFHEALRRDAREALKSLLDAIASYERFARLCQDAFDDCLCEMTRKRGKTTPAELSRLSTVRLACRRVPESFGEVMDRLEPFGQSVPFRDKFANLSERCGADEWVSRLAQHHGQTQRHKPPDGKNPWFERFDDGSFIIRPLYRRENGGSHEESYVHAYRTHSLWSFAKDLNLVKR
jgi:hypothetical protein